MNFCKYSRLYLPFISPISSPGLMSILTSSDENVDFAEFSDPLASIVNLFSWPTKVHASATMLQSSIASARSMLGISTLAENSRLGIVFSSVSISMRLSLNSLFILSCISTLSVLSSVCMNNELPGLHLLSIDFKLSRLTPMISSSTSSCEKASFGSLNDTNATFAGSIATIETPCLLTFILTSMTNSDIIDIMSDKIFGSSSLSSIFSFLV